jgi:hypothetical protein
MGHKRTFGSWCRIKEAANLGGLLLVLIRLRLLLLLDDVCAFFLVRECSPNLSHFKQ